MIRMITITVVNGAANNLSFFFYVGPAQYTSAGNIYAQSLISATVAPSTSGGDFTLQIPFDYYAASQQVVSSIGVQPKPSAIQGISLSTTSGATNDSTQMSINPLGLAPPTPNSNVPAGAFRVAVPVYDSDSQNYNVGTGLKSQSGVVILTSYILANPNTNIDVTPSTTFCVAIGNYGPGQQITPSQITNYGACNASSNSAFNVTYQSNGTFVVQSFASDINTRRDSRSGRVVKF
jgi:hypothetical protein